MDFNLPFVLMCLLPATWLAVSVYFFIRIFRDQCTKSHDYKKICEVIKREHFISQKGNEWDSQEVYDIFECTRCRKRILRHCNGDNLSHENR